MISKKWISLFFFCDPFKEELFMSLKRLSLGESKKENNSQFNNYVGEIQEYQSGRYILKISNQSLEIGRAHV